jgi:hypothetical protein
MFVPPHPTIPNTMRLTVPEYLTELSATSHTHYLDWEAIADLHFRKVIGSLTFDLHFTPLRAQWVWTLQHANHGRLFSGSSTTATIAMLEALTYARSWVQQQPQLNAL